MKIKGKAVQIVAWGICVVLVIASIVLVVTDQKKYQERIIEMQLKSQAEAEEVKKKEREHIEEKTKIYSELVSDLELHDFVIWGSNDTSEKDGISFSGTLEEIINQQIHALLSESFESVIDSTNNTIPAVLINDMRVTDEGMQEILTRSGVDDIEIGEWAMIPKEPELINLVLKNSESGIRLHFAEQKEADFGKVTISGVVGKLTAGDGEYDEDHPDFAFIRDEEGDSFQVGVGTNVEVESATKYISSVPVFFFGEDTVESVESVDDFVTDAQRLVEMYVDSDEENGWEKPYVIVCTTDKDSELDEALEESFGDNYIRNPYNKNMASESNYGKLAKTVYTELDNQGCFGDIKGKITEAEEKLKDLNAD